MPDEMITVRRLVYAPEFIVTSDGRVFREAEPLDFAGTRWVDIPHAGHQHYPMKLDRVVADAFLPPRGPDQSSLVSHVDGDGGNNHAANLRWAPRSVLHRLATAFSSEELDRE